MTNVTTAVEQLTVHGAAAGVASAAVDAGNRTGDATVMAPMYKKVGDATEELEVMGPTPVPPVPGPQPDSATTSVNNRAATAANVHTLRLDAFAVCCARPWAAPTDSRQLKAIGRRVVLNIGFFLLQIKIGTKAGAVVPLFRQRFPRISFKTFGRFVHHGFKGLPPSFG